ncbi:hypothetical protein Dimus_039410 [Dionaea muscipula]
MSTTGVGNLSSMLETRLFSGGVSAMRHILVWTDRHVEIALTLNRLRFGKGRSCSYWLALPPILAGSVQCFPPPCRGVAHADHVIDFESLHREMI